MSTAILYRMQAGFPGDVNRTHPASIVPILNDPTSPVLKPGQVGIYTGAAQSMRAVASGDAAANGTDVKHIAGIAVRSFPVQASTPNANFDAQGFGNGLLPAGIVDRLQSGFIMVVVNGTPNLGDPVYVWAAASTGNHVQGQFESASSATNTFALPSTCYFNGPPDASGNVEICVGSTS